MRIGLISGFWSTNIGNAFFHLGAYSLLKRFAESGDEVIVLNNQPAYWRLLNKKNPRHAARGIGEPHLDVLVMVGPFLRRAFPEIWGGEIQDLQAKGTKVVMLGLGAMQHDARTREMNRAWFARARPDFIATRDERTFQTLDGLGLNLEAGICPAFFVSDVLKPTRSQEPYMVVNCEKVPEPMIRDKKSGSKWSPEALSVGGREFFIEQYNVPTSVYLERAAELATNVRSLLPRRSPAQVGGLVIYRTIHRSNPFVGRNLFARPNTMVSDIPQPYLLAYANAECIITDRVHSAVAGIAFRTPVVFVGKTKRQGLLEAAGARLAQNGLVSVDKERLEGEKKKLSVMVSREIFGKGQASC